MAVANCKVQFIRPQYQNLKEWMDDPTHVYIGRAGVDDCLLKKSGSQRQRLDSRIRS